MSARYSIAIDLDAPYDTEVVQNILAKGMGLDVIYYKFMDYEGRRLNPTTAANWCLEQNKDLDPHCLTTKIEGIYTNLHFINRGGYVTVMLSGISFERLKQFSYEIEDIDIGRYAKIMLDLVSDFRISRMYIEKS
jgi:hypothetical protein